MPVLQSPDKDREVTIREVVKVSVLGEGSQGTVWTARRKGSRGKSLNSVPYALKQRLIKKADAALRDTKTSSALREIEFYKRVANRHPDHFSKLYDWEITEASDEMREAFITEDADITKYTHMLTTLSARKEGVLRTVYHSLSRGQWLSMIAQVCYAISLLHDKGFSHGDVWESNIGYMRIPWNRDVGIYRSSVPGLGYMWSIIDYGSVELTADETEKERTKKRASSYELDDMISLVSGEDDAYDECGKEAVDIKSGDFRRRVLSSIDGPSVKELMKKTGLPIWQVLALLNLDAYLLHVCGHERTSKTKSFPWVGRDALLRLSEMKVSYGSLALYFAKLARDEVKSQRR